MYDRPDNSFRNSRTIDCVPRPCRPCFVGKRFAPSHGRHGRGTPRSLLGLGVVLGMLLCASPTTVVAAERYFGVFRDGAVAVDAEIRDWNDVGAVPKLADRELFAANNPVQWIIDRQQPAPSIPDSYVEFFGGDRLAGEVVGYRAGAESPFDAQPPHLLVRSAGEVQSPDELQATVTRVGLERVRRIIWEHRGAGAYRPATVVLRNGGEVTFRSVRWTDAGVSLLTEQGLRSIPWSDLAELHFPQQDEWQTYVEALTVLSPDLKSPLLTVETADGHRCTASTSRMQARHWGDRNRPEAWLHLLQPEWALDPLWIRYRTCTSWTAFLPEEPPLSWMSPSSIEQTSVFSSVWLWQPNRSTLGERLKAKDREYTSGFGVHASTDLKFLLPASAKGFRSWAALDPSVGQGGCVNLAVIADGSRGLFQRDTLVGAQDPIDTGWLNWNPGSVKSLTLRADMARDNRPAKADPFDIRDITNWCAPTLQLDPLTLAKDVATAQQRRGAVLPGWSLSEVDAASILSKSVFDSTDTRDLRFRKVLRTRDRFVIASRSIKVGADHRWLSLAISRFAENTAASTVQIKIDGRSAGEFEVPLRQGPIDPDPLLVPVHDFQGRTVTVEAVLYSPTETSFVDWRGLALTTERPGVRQLFEDDEALVKTLRADRPVVETATEPVFSGKISLKMNPGVVEAPQYFEAPAAVVELPKLGQYRFLVFAWQGTGERLVLRLAHEGRLGTSIAEGLIGRGAAARNRLRRRSIEDRGLRYGFSYDIGSQKPEELPPLRLERAVPKDWRFESRDLFGDFGSLQLTGLGLECAEGGSGYFDHLYLARTPQDVDFLRSYRVASKSPPPNPDPTYAQRAIVPADWGPMVASFAPVFAITEAAHGLVELREHMGQSGAWQTHPHDQQRPFVFRTGLHLPADKPQQLSLRVSHLADKDWSLVVKVNGEVIHQELINTALTRPQRGWASIRVDLSKFAGQKILLEVQNASNDWSNEHAFWKRIALEDQ